MSASPQLDIDHIAKLARLALTSEEKAKFAQQLGDVLHHIEQLAKVDVTGVEPTAHASPVFNVWQADVAQPGLAVADALRNAPAQRDNMVAVPKVVE
jgi:aspartyl-tRNA(Asn)/glutamyl-tRNA(Gln) amidotransferase subunit C